MVAPVHHQLVVYAADPHRLARFYAEAMGYVLEDTSSFIESLLAMGAVKESDTVVIDDRRFFAEAVAIRHPDDPVDPQRGSGRGRRILFELQATAKTDENRLHIDLNVGRDRLDEETARLVGIGATLLYERRNWPPGEFNRLADPEGNEFCLQ
jgi:predicted enzyme related to lactoylglutathione lyase